VCVGEATIRRDLARHDAESAPFWRTPATKAERRAQREIELASQSRRRCRTSGCVVGMHLEVRCEGIAIG
jgi:hypothetical protein